MKSRLCLQEQNLPAVEYKCYPQPVPQAISYIMKNPTFGGELRCYLMYEGILDKGSRIKP